MFKGSRKYWLIAISCGLIASLLCYRFLREVEMRYQPDDLVEVVQAKTDISKDTVIRKEELELLSLPGKYSHPDAARKIEEVVGRIATSDISSGEEVLKQHILSSKDNSDRLAYSIPLSKRAVSIPIDEISGVSGYIKPGDHLDIIATIDIPVIDVQGNEKLTGYSILSLQDIEVLAVGVNPDSSGKKENAQTVTLCVSIPEAQPLVLASERGNLRLLLRSPVDDSRVSLPPMELKDFLK